MARLKVKQISDFTTEVQSLITANDSNDSASIAALSTAVAVEQGEQDASINSLEGVVATGVTKDGEQDNSIDALQSTDVLVIASIDALQAADANIIKSIEANDADNLTLTGSVNSLETAVSVETTKNAQQDASITSLEGIDTALSAEIVTEKDRIDAILGAIDGGDVDNFAEVVSLINQVDQTNDNAFAAYALATDASIDSLEKVDEGLQSQITSNDGDISNLQASVDALNTDVAELNNSVNSLETAVSVESTKNAEQDASINSLESIDAALAAVNTAQDASISSLETLADDAFGAGMRIHQMGTVTGTTTFTIPLAVDSSEDSDIVVFVNGKNEQMYMAEVNTNGWVSANGAAFSLTGIGYDIDAEDEVYVIAPLAGAGEGGGVAPEAYTEKYEQRRA